ncbi:MAG TPA: class I SAM-dependent methyltransferase [Burkholderiales bacterium]|nr:class I SAM-dependent methyltransferase [Burkholderiales bacterium]
MSDDYFIGVHARELERLRDQHAAWQPETHALWARAGFANARHIADLGSGPGFTTFDLARLVGSEGAVTAIDKAAPFLRYVEEEAQRRGVANVRTRAADVVDDALGKARFDGAFCRFFLAFVIDELDAVLANIRDSLEPGGVFAMMEYLTLDAATCSPPVRGFDAHTRGWIAYYRANGGDTTVGSVLPAKLASAGFEVVATDCVGGMARSGTRWWHWWGRLMSDFGDTLAEGGFMSADEVRELHEDWARATADPLAFIHTPVLVQIVARRR